MITILFTITGLYVILILSFISGFRKIKEFKTHYKQFDVSFSIIIPFRDEAAHLPQLLESINSLTYFENKYEIIFVDDESTDNSVEIIHQYLSKTATLYSVITNERASNSPKKDAISTAIKKAQFEWIITTDADCILPKHWLYQFGEFSSIYGSKMLVAPVNYASHTSSFLEHFQILDFLSLQGATIGGFGIKRPFLCNGANLAYEKKTFLELEGFQGNDNIASGDDIFLFEKFYRAYPDSVHFLKSQQAIVTTSAVKTWKELIIQRTRWAAKSSSYRLLFGKLVGLIVLLMNLSIIVSFISLFWNQVNFIPFLLILIAKNAVDFTLIAKTSIFYRGKNKKIRDYEFGSILYPFFSVYIVIKALTSKYSWKGREFRR